VNRIQRPQRRWIELGRAIKEVVVETDELNGPEVPAGLSEKPCEASAF